MKNYENFKKTRGESLLDKPVILIIDEVDNYGKKSFSFSNSSRNNNEEINNLLKMFDEIERQNLNIIIIGITNYPDELEPALVRTGRFGTNRIEFSYLTEEEAGKMIEIFKEKVLGQETGSYKHEDNKDLWKDDKKNYVVKLDNAFWRDIEIIIMDKIQEAKEKSVGFSFTDFENALDKTLLKGLKKKRWEIDPDPNHYQEILKKLLEEKIKEDNKQRTLINSLI